MHVHFGDGHQSLGPHHHLADITVAVDSLDDSVGVVSRRVEVALERGLPRALEDHPFLFVVDVDNTCRSVFFVAIVFGVVGRVVSQTDYVADGGLCGYGKGELCSANNTARSVNDILFAVDCISLGIGMSRQQEYSCLHLADLGDAQGD
jgi:hypothetical protein